MPKQKLYAKWDIAARKNSLAAYFFMLCVVVSLGDKKPHDGSRQPADHMKDNDKSFRGIAGKQRPCQVV